MSLATNDSIRLPEMSAPATPPSGFVEVYAKSDGKLYIKDDTGAETDITTPGAPAVGDLSMKPGMSAGVPGIRSSFDWFVSEGLGKWTSANSSGAKVFDSSAYPDLLASGLYANYYRGRVFRMGTTWGCHPVQATGAAPTFAQTTTDLTTMVNRDIPSACVDYNISASWIDEANGKYVAIIWGSTSYIYSSDGITWTFVPYIYAASATAVPSTLSNPVVVNGTYSFYDTVRLRRYYTTDHTTFTQVPTTVLTGADHLGTVHLCNGLLFLFKNSSTTYYTSNDGGITWVARTWPATAGAGNLAPTIVHNGTVYLFTTTAATSNTSIWTSPDLTTWTNQTCTFTAATTIGRLAVANSVFFAFSNSSQTKFCTSPDGATWTERTASSAAQYGMAAYVNSKYMIFSTGRTEGSAALTTWAAETTSGPSQLSRIGSDVFLVIDTANSKLAFCTSSNVWTAYSGGAWSSILNTAQLNSGTLKSHGASGTNWQYVVRVKA